MIKSKISIRSSDLFLDVQRELKRRWSAVRDWVLVNTDEFT